MPTATPYPGEAGHFTSWLHHIGGSDVLAYDDLDGRIWHPATPKQSKEFSSGKMRHAPAAAIYYLVGGEATQEALYQQHLEYLRTHFGISIQPPQSGQQWPSTTTLSSQFPGYFKQLPGPRVQSYFQPIPHLKHHIVLWQGYSPPRPKPCFSGTQPLQPSVVQQSHWQYIPADPTEEFFDQSKDSAQAKHQIIPDALPCLPATRNLLAQSVTVPDGLVEWNTGILVDLSLWGSEKEDDGPSYEEELAMQRAQRRNKGYRPASPPRFSNNNSIPSMVDILEGIAAFSL